MTVKRLQQLREQIAAAGAVLDRRYGNQPGTAERAIYWWHWPPEGCGLATLRYLYDDALVFLGDNEASTSHDNAA